MTPQKRQSKGAEDEGRFVLEAHLESRLVLADENENKATVEKKKIGRLSMTLKAMSSSLDKGSTLASLGRDRFDEDWIVQDAAITVLTDIGAEVKRLPQSFTSTRSTIEWTKIAGVRDKLKHDDVAIDLNLVWDALVKDLPMLRATLNTSID